MNYRGVIWRCLIFFELIFQWNILFRVLLWTFLVFQQWVSRMHIIILKQSKVMEVIIYSEYCWLKIYKLNVEKFNWKNYNLKYASILVFVNLIEMVGIKKTLNVETEYKLYSIKICIQNFFFLKWSVKLSFKLWGYQIIIKYTGCPIIRLT